ncbi:MAG: acyltransferase [Anaerolineae bacterium]|nr:MAG: acyltransferase [Anaerolineae bacterium]
MRVITSPTALTPRAMRAMLIVRTTVRRERMPGARRSAQAGLLRDMNRIGFYQFAPQFGQVERNLAQVVAALRDVRDALIVLPELAFTGYSFRDRAEVARLAEDPRRSSTVDALVALCRERDLHLVTGFAERDAGGPANCSGPRLGGRPGNRLYNSALLLGPEGLLHVYRKLHLFGREKECFDPGDIPLQVHDVRGLRLGLMVCFDWAFPEVVRSLALQGADVVCHPANLVLNYCQQTMLARCIENGVYALTANRYGIEERPHGVLTFTGQSQVVAPKGKLLYRSPPEGDDLYITEVDVALARDKALTGYNDILADRRPEFYQQLCQRRE